MTNTEQKSLLAQVELAKDIINRYRQLIYEIGAAAKNAMGEPIFGDDEKSKNLIQERSDRCFDLCHKLSRGDLDLTNYLKNYNRERVIKEELLGKL